MPSRILSIFRITTITIVLVVSVVGAQGQRSSNQPPIPAVSYASFSSKEIRVFDLINRERMKYGLRLLNWDERLANLARIYSRKMADEDFFDHLDLEGNDVAMRARSMRIRGWNRIGENLFECEGERDPTRLSVRGWMESATHRQNLLDPDWMQTGIGIAETSEGRFFVTQVFTGR